MNQQGENIGLIGVGLLGLAIAERLAEKRVEVCGFDVDEERCRKLSGVGGTAAESAQDVFDRCELVLISLPTSEIAGQVLRSAQTHVGQTIVDTTTGQPEQMMELAEFMTAAGGHYAEATVAGSSVQMRVGEASIFLGCNTETHRRIAELTNQLSQRCFYLGDVGSASRFKLVHNLVLGLHRAVLAEGLAFAESLGFEAAQVLEILQQTPAASTVMSTKGQKMVDREYATQARLSQHLKDVRLILELAASANASTPLSHVHRELLESAEHLGYGDADNSAVIEAYRERKDAE